MAKKDFEADAIVYDLDDIQHLLSIGRTSAYDYIRKVYKEKKPFPVMKLGSMYRIPKKAFDTWIEKGCPEN